MGKIISNYKYGKLHFLIILGLISLFYPYEFSSVYFPFLPKDEYIIVFVLLIVVTFLYGFNKKFKIEVLHLIFIQVIGFCLVEISHGKYLPVIDYTMKMLFAGLLLGVVTQKIGLKNFYRRYNRWIALMAVLGTLTFFLVLFFDYSPRYNVVDRADGRTIFNYLLTFSKSDYFLGVHFRYAGYFDEPGAMAFWGLFALIFNRLFVKDKRIEIVLIVSLLFTFSMGFFFQLFFYVLFFMISSKYQVRMFFSAIIIALLAFLAYQTKETEYNFIYKSTFARVERVINVVKMGGSIGAVDNRYRLQRKAYKTFLEAPVLGSSKADGVYLGDNIYEPLAKYGILGSLLLYSPLFYIFYLSWKYKRNDIRNAMIIIFIGFFHRPIHMNVLSFFIMYSLVLFTTRDIKFIKKQAND